MKTRLFNFLEILFLTLFYQHDESRVNLMYKSMRRRVSGTFEERKDEGRGNQDRIGSDLIDSQPVQIVEDV